MDIAALWRWAARSPREQEKSFQIDFPVLEDKSAASFSVSVTLKSYGPGFQHVLSINVTGAAHPYDLNDDGMNPALVPALHLLRKDLPVIARAAMDEAGLGTRSMSFFDAHHNDGQPSTRDHATGLHCLLRFNPHDHTYPNPGYQAATPRQIGVFYESVVADLKILEPALRDIITANRKDYPPIPLDQAEALNDRTTHEINHLRVTLAAGFGGGHYDDTDIEAMVTVAQRPKPQPVTATNRFTRVVRDSLQRRFG